MPPSDSTPSARRSSGPTTSSRQSEQQLFRTPLGLRAAAARSRRPRKCATPTSNPPVARREEPSPLHERPLLDARDDPRVRRARSWTRSRRASSFGPGHTDFFAAVRAPGIDRVARIDTRRRRPPRRGSATICVPRSRTRSLESDFELAYALATAYGLLCIYRGPQTEGKDVARCSSTSYRRCCPAIPARESIRDRFRSRQAAGRS